MNTVAGVVVVIAAIVIVKVTWKRPNTGARIAAIGAVAFAIWLLIAMKNPGDAVKFAGWVVAGVAAAATGAAHLIGMI